MPKILTKICTKCLKELPLECFSKHKDGLYGVHSQCKLCIKKYREENKERLALNRKKYDIKHANELKEYKKKYYQKNKEKLKQKNKANKHKYDFSKYNKKYRKSHINKIKLYAKKHREETKEQTKIYGKKYRIKNSEIIKLKNKKYNQRPEVKQKNIIRQQQRRALKKSLEHNFGNKDWETCKQYFKNKCAYCGKEVALEQEHFIALNKGGEYTKNNIVPVCRSCNASKNAQDFFKWYPIQTFYSKEREKKILKYLHYNKNKKAQQLTLII